jgi:hypothetical protein
MSLVLDGDTGIVGVLLTDGNGNVIFDTNTLYVDAPNNKVGIGTINPNRKLEIISEIDGSPLRIQGNSSVTQMEFAVSGGTVEAGIASSANELAFRVGSSSSSSEKMRITSTGNVGIGETNPEYSLDMGIGETIRLRHTSNSSAIRVGASDYDVNLIRFDGSSGQTDNAYYGGALRYMGSRASDANSLSVFMDNSLGTEVEAMTFLQNGYVGIGTSNPQNNLHIQKSSGSDTPGTGHIKFSVADDGGPGWIFRVSDTADDGDFHIDRQFNGSFYSSLRIDRETGVMFGSLYCSEYSENEGSVSIGSSTVNTIFNNTPPAGTYIINAYLRYKGTAPSGDPDQCRINVRKNSTNQASADILRNDSNISGASGSSTGLDDYGNVVCAIHVNGTDTINVQTYTTDPGDPGGADCDWGVQVYRIGG